MLRLDSLVFPYPKFHGSKLLDFISLSFFIAKTDRQKMDP